MTKKDEGVQRSDAGKRVKLKELLQIYHGTESAKNKMLKADSNLGI